MTRSSRNPPYLPDFLGIGVQKGGTTTLYHLLAEHPEIYLAKAKEVHYFTLNYSQGIDWYSAHFKHAEPQQCIGEITPYYVFHPETPKRVSELIPQAKLIVLLRDPVERTLSQYFHSRRLGLEQHDLTSALMAETERIMGAEKVLHRQDGRHRSHQEHSYISRSRYEQQIQRWRHHFNDEQILIERSENLFRQPEYFWERLQEFLELEQIPLPLIGRERSNMGLGEAAQVPEHIVDWLRDELTDTYRWLEDIGIY